MPIDTNKFLDDAVQNIMALLRTQRAAWGIKEVYPFQGILRAIYPCLEVNAAGATMERIESGGGYRVNISIDVMYWFHQVNEELAKRELDQRTSEIAIFIASHPSLDDYANDVTVDGITITALPEQEKRDIWTMVSIISCTVSKDIFLTFE